MYSELSNNYPEFKQTHNEYQHFYLQQLQNAKQAFYDQQINLADNKNQATWKIINDMKNKPYSDKHKIILLLCHAHNQLINLKSILPDLARML